MTRAEERIRATQLKAVDVRELIRSSLPHVLPQLTAAHMDDLQRVLDAAVINADVHGKWEELDRQSIRGRIGNSNQHLRDPAKVAVRDRVLTQKVAVKAEYAIRLDWQKLLTHDALKPMSDNPDEAAYLLMVADVYAQRGVWLLLDSSMGAMTQKMHPNDPRKWRVRLVLGYRPGGLIAEIETTGNGSLTRRALLSVTRLGAGYYEWVHLGPTLRVLKSALDRVSNQISLGRSEHAWWSVHRTQYYVVSRISDKLGGADWPKESIWEQPHQMYIQALQLINDGKLTESTRLAQLAALQAGFCAKTVHEYIAATTKGASRAAKVLGVAEVCGKIAEAFLLLRALGQGMVRLLGRKGSTNAAGGQRQLTDGQRPAPATPEPVPTPSPVPGGGAPRPGRGGTLVDNTQPPLPPPVPRAVPREMTPIAEAVNNVRRQNGLPPLPERTLLLPSGMATEAQLTRLHNEFLAWLQANPNASLTEKLARLERLNQAEWGAWFPTR